jgi:hypothetical protein
MTSSAASGPAGYPPTYRFLAGQHEDSLDATARSADRILQVASHSALASVGSNPPPERGVPLQQIEDLSRQVAALSTELTRLRGSSRDPRPSSRTRRSATDPHPEMTLHPTLAGINAASGPERKSVLLPATTASRKTKTADINGGSRLHLKQRPPLRHG